METKKEVILGESNHPVWIRWIGTLCQSKNCSKVIEHKNFNLFYASINKTTLEKEFDAALLAISKDRALAENDKKLATLNVYQDTAYKSHIYKWECNRLEKEEAWNDDDEKAQAMIKTSVESYYQSLLVKAVTPTAYSMMVYLAANAKQAGLSYRFSSWKGFTSIKWFYPLLEFLKKNTEAIQALVAIEIELPEDILYMMILEKLPTQYDSMVARLIHVPAKEYTIVNLRLAFASSDNWKPDEIPHTEEAMTTTSIRVCINCKCKLGDVPIFHTRCSKCQDEFVKERNGKKKKLRKEAAKANTATAKEKGQKETEKKEQRETEKKRYKSRRYTRSTSSSAESSYSVTTASAVDKKEEVNALTWADRVKYAKYPMYVDSACTKHITNEVSILTNKEASNVRISGAHANVKSSTAKVQGELNIEVKNSKTNATHNFKLENVLYDKNIRRNLFSVREETKKGTPVLFVRDQCFVLDKIPDTSDCKTLLQAQVDHNGLYAISDKISQGMAVEVNSVSTSKQLTLQEVHEIWNHAAKPKLVEMIRDGLIPADQVKRETGDVEIKCDVCAIAKQTRKKFAKTKSFHADAVGDILHSDLCGPISPPSLGNNSYFITYTDEKSDFTFIALTNKKSHNFSTLKKVRERVKTQAGKRVKMLVSDGGGEYIGAEVEEYLDKKGIVHEITPAYTPQSNGKSERLNRTINNSVRCMIAESKVHASFWGDLPVG